MKTLIPTISLIIGCISLISCGNSQTNSVEQPQAENSLNTGTGTQIQYDTATNDQPQNSPTQVPSQQIAANIPNKQPQVGIVKELVNGDLLCYATLVDENGTKYNVGSSFEICAAATKYLNKKVRATYQIESVSDCQSNEPCGKTRKESIITKMEVLETEPSTKSPDSNTQTLSNGEWTITIGNSNSWSGVNGTGDLTYQGCDKTGKCINLTGGKISCRDGKCVTGWINGDYAYTLEQTITEEGNAPTTLVVRKNAQEILKATGFKLVPAN
ncbi:hypothetical protein VB711_22350 [Cronbergia sp. UHCC 0137]|uniref:hypothetical protein n=1 Tax=Cronbergia sp. UHCC 0137 TaxID=3110239 RepID=UPI002B2185EB|nr:hypothetical protein [Cronbergia sp. UHCC 0137]MEA5620558.1 hypothetical protein [Cronbergia sp. UHCC 0137]